MKYSMKKEDNKPAMLLTLFLYFFKVGAFTFGGGLSMLPVLTRDLVEIKKWASEEEMIDYFAIGQSTPGIIAVNVATFIGYKKAGITGAVSGVIGIIFSSLIIITLIAAFISNFSDIVWIQKALKGINVSVAVLLLKAVFTFGKKTIFDVFTFLIAVFAFVAMFIFKIQGVWIVLFSAFLGWLIQTAKNIYLKKTA